MISCAPAGPGWPSPGRTIRPLAVSTPALSTLFSRRSIISSFRQIERGEPLRMHYPPSGSPRINRPIAILASSPRKETAEKFVDFYLSPTVQQAVADVFLIPARQDIPPAPVRTAAGSFKVMPQDIREGLAIMPRVLRRFQREIERARID